jgi:peptidoglycan/LPS O-acetylase OafA/YrhL
MCGCAPGRERHSLVEPTTAPAPLRSYRPDIDGLRAVAVALVVAYHYFPGTVGGGFIGVDIFFAISGFLITSLIAEAIEDGRFRFRDFYARRARRIFPALAVILAFSLLAGAVLLDISEYRTLGLHVAAGAGFLSNALLWSEAGYFDEAAGYKPLLHLWSLAIEEQFYLLWPAALYLWARLGRPLWPLAAACAAGSFVFNVYLSTFDQVADFYFIFTRIWELLLGATLALAAPAALHGRPRLANGAAAIGVVLIVASALLINAAQPFPGWRAAGPTLGATLLIAAGPVALFNARVLALRPMVAIGKISYPIYLWHWPLLVFARYATGGEFGPPVRWALIAIAVVLSQATYVFVEKPIRFGAPRAARTAYAVVAIAVLGLVGLRDFDAGGLLFPNATFVRVVNEGDIGSQQFRAYVAAHSALCDAKVFPPTVNRSADPLSCRESIAGAPPDVVILGDSHAEHLYLGLAEALPGHNVVSYSGAAMPSIEDPSFAPIYQALATNPGVKTVIISAAWKVRLAHLRQGENLREELDRTAKLLLAAGKRVYLVNDVPYFESRVGRCKFAGDFGLPHRCDEPQSELERQLALYAGDLAAVVAANPGARLIDTAHMLCADGRCSMAIGGKLLYRDSNHLNLNGTRFIGAKIVAAAPELAN